MIKFMIKNKGEYVKVSNVHSNVFSQRGNVAVVMLLTLLAKTTLLGGTRIILIVT